MKSVNEKMPAIRMVRWVATIALFFVMPVQANDLTKALDLFNRIQRALPAAPASGKPQPPPQSQPQSQPSPPVQSSKPVAAGVGAATALDNDRGWRFTHQPKSKLLPGQRIEHDTSKRPVTGREWAANYDNWAAPEATSRFASGMRPMLQKYFTPEVELMKYQISNPYIPIDRVDLPNPNWVISPYFEQGFFSKITAWSCRPDGTLYVEGAVGEAADGPRGQHYAKGIWRVAPDGQILAYSVYPGSGYLERTRPANCTRTDACDLPANPARDRALAELSDAWVEDRHGNVWAIRSNRGNGTAGYVKKTCAITRYNADGSDTIIQDHASLCEAPEGYNTDFLNRPNKIAYDPLRDEVVVAAGNFGGNRPGSQALLRINQAGQISELMRNWAQAEIKNPPNPPGKDRKNSKQVRERWWDIEDLHFNPLTRAISFETSIFSEHSYPGRTYEIHDSFASLKRLQWNSPGQLAPEEVFGKGTIGDDQRLIGLSSGSSLTSRIFTQSCFDSAGNRYFGGNLGIRKMDANGNLSTWVK